MFNRLIISIGLILIITSPVLSQNHVFINEIMASNYESAFDEDYESSDWIELFNNSTSSVNLQGYRISDKNNFSNAWEIPDTAISGKGRILIYASEKSRTSSNKYFIKGSGHGIQSAFPNDWFRYQYINVSGDFDIKMRVHSLRNADTNGSVGLMMRENHLKGSPFCGVFSLRQDRETFSFMYRSELEQLPSTTFSNYPLEYPKGWIRLKREGDSIYAYTVDDANKYYWIGTYYYPAPNTMLVGIAVASANDDKLATAAITDLTLNGKPIPYDTLIVEEVDIETPGRSYFSNELHTDFKLNADGEKLYLWNRQGALIDSMSFPGQTVDISYGRYPDGTNNRQFFSPSTPEEENQPGANSYAEEPIFSVSAGWYNSQVLLYFENNNPGLQIRYTRDGSNATDTSELYDGNPVVLDSTTVIRARAYKTGLFASKEIVNSYILNDSCTLPVVSFAVSNDKLWDSTNGIFMYLWPARETDGNFEMFNTYKSRFFTSHTGLRVHGYNSRTYAQKSLRLSSRSKYDTEEFGYPFFGNDYLPSFNELIFRNSGIDWHNSHIRDEFCAVIAGQIPSQDASKYHPYISYLNGEYWGLYDLRERLDEHFVSMKYKVPIESISLLEQNEHVVSGTIGDYNVMIDKIFSADMSKPESYKMMDSLICLENIIDYTALELYCNNMDWPWNNMKFWNSTSLDGKWRWILHDLDWTFGLWGAPPYFDLMPIALKPDTCEFTNMFLKMLENQKFRERFINKFADLMNSVFLNVRMKKTLDSMAAEMEPEMQRHINKWGAKDQTYQKWQGELSNIRIFIKERAGWQREHIVKFFNLESSSKVKLDINIKGSGQIKINTLDISDFPWEGYYFNKIPFNIQAVPGTGYKFSGWKTSLSFNDSTGPEQTIILQGEASISANFDKIKDTDSNIVINEIMYQPADSANSEDWIELYNPDSHEIDLSGWKLMDSDEGHTFHIPEGTVLKGLSYLVLSSDTLSFLNVNPGIETIIGNFNFGFGLPDEVRLLNRYSEVIDSVYYSSTAPWPSDCDGTGKSIELINPHLNNVLGENWESSKILLGTPGRENSVYLDVQYPDLDNDNYKCFPNPFRDKLKISVIMNDTQRSNVQVFNIHGQKVKTILDNKLITGSNEFIWNGTDDSGNKLNNGVYFCVFSNNKNRYVFKLIKLNQEGETK